MLEENKVQVRINGNTYTMSGAESEAYLYRLGQYVDRKVQEVTRAYTRVSATDAAVLAAVTIADELLKLRDENALLDSRVSQAINPGAEVEPLVEMETLQPSTVNNPVEGKSVQEGSETFLPSPRNKAKRHK